MVFEKNPEEEAKDEELEEDEEVGAGFCFLAALLAAARRFWLSILTGQVDACFVCPTRASFP